MLDVLYEDNHLLVINKPALLPTMGVAEHVPSLLVLARDYIKRKYNKPGNVYLGIVSRLDAPVTGVVLLARTSKAAARLSEQFRDHDVEKTYWAVVEGRVELAVGRLNDYLRKDERHRRVHVTSERAEGAQMATLDFTVLSGTAEGSRLRDKSRFSLLDIRPITGRKHQIRVQLSHAGMAIVGDRKYGSTQPFSAGIALHSRKLAIEHPVTKIKIDFEAPLPASWSQLFHAAE